MYYIGIDVGGTNLKAGLVDESYALVAAKSRPLAFESQEAMGETLVRMAMELAEEENIPREQIASIGMGFPGPVDDRRGVVVKTTNIPLREMPVADMVHRRWDVPVHLGNDADCAAWGEYRCFAPEAESLILVTLGTGVGTGVILDGKLRTGINSCAAEGGHMVIAQGGRPCPCGRQGCWEQYASATALIRDTREAMERDPGSALWKAAGSLEAVDGRTAFTALHMGDSTAKAVVDSYIRYLAAGIVNFINIFQPEVVCIGGGVSKAADEDLLLPLQRLVRELSFDTEELKPHTRLVKARLGNDAGIIGAALLGAPMAR